MKCVKTMAFAPLPAESSQIPSRVSILMICNNVGTGSRGHDSYRRSAGTCYITGEAEHE